MSSNSEFFLKKTLGEDFTVLFKTEIFKPGTRSVVDTEDIEHGLKLVPRVLMSFLIRELVPMAVGEHKEINVPVKENVILKVTKNERDCVSGEIIENNKKIYDFINRTIPGLGLVLLSSLELYDLNQLEKPDQTEDVGSKVQKIVDERLMLHDLINKVVDQKIAQKDAIKELMFARLTHELHETNEELERERVRLAGCGVAALGYAQDVKPGEYGHSPSLEYINDLYKENIDLKNKVKDVTDIAKDPGNSGANEYMRGMANGLEVANSIVNNVEPSFIDAPKKESPIKHFLANRKNKKPQFNIQLTKSEHVNCPDCNGEIFNGTGISACICFGDSGKVYLKKSEKGYTVSFGRGWEPENIEMLLDLLRSKRG